jgi:hypothetical protein
MNSFKVKRGWMEGDKTDRRTRKQYKRGDRSKDTKLIKEINKLFSLQ